MFGKEIQTIFMLKSPQNSNERNNESNMYDQLDQKYCTKEWEEILRNSFTFKNLKFTLDFRFK